VSKLVKLVHDFGQTKSLTQKSDNETELVDCYVKLQQVWSYHLYFIIIIITLPLSLLKPLLLLLFGQSFWHGIEIKSHQAL